MSSKNVLKNLFNKALLTTTIKKLVHNMECVTQTICHARLRGEKMTWRSFTNCNLFSSSKVFSHWVFHSMVLDNL